MSITTNTQLRVAGRHRSHRAGLRTVALFEALKGVLALLVALAFIHMIHRDVDFGDVAERILRFLHFGLHHRLAQLFLNAAGKLSDAHIATVLGIAIAYATLRFAEGYGLWKQRAWAEWLAIISGCIYIPFEVERLVRHPNWVHWIVLLINILVVLYIAWVRWDEIKTAHAAKA